MWATGCALWRPAPFPKTRDGAWLKLSKRRNKHTAKPPAPAEAGPHGPVRPAGKACAGQKDSAGEKDAFFGGKLRYRNHGFSEHGNYYNIW